LSQTLAAWGYGLAACAFVVLAGLLGAGWKGGLRAMALFAAAALSAAWAALACAQALTLSPALGTGVRVLDALRLAAWFAFVALLLPGRMRHAWLVVGAIVALAGALLFPDAPGRITVEAGIAPYAAGLATAVAGLVAAEQLFRATASHLRWAIKPLVLGLAAMFAYDLFLYSEALLFRQLDAGVWAARGVAHALVIPLVAVATARNTQWSVDIAVSRGVVFHSTALVLCGAYLLVVAGAGYWVRYFGGTWGGTLQALLVFGALVALALVVGSGRFRSRLRVFVSKHFYSYRYDYREEWLRFTSTLSSHNPHVPLPETCIRALGDLVESASGALWLVHGETLRQVARIAMPAVRETERLDGPLASYLARTGWVVEVRDAAARPQAHDGLALPGWLSALPRAWLIVPLQGAEGLAGFVVLGAPRTPLEVDWEVRDLLKTAGRQAASYLGHMQSAEALLEVQKFAAFNRMSAFVVHDLKNLVAQLSLVLANAPRHRDNPEFQQDVLDTVQHVVTRMNALMLQLRVGTVPIDQPRAVDLAAIVQRVQRAKRGAHAPLVVEVEAGLRAVGHEERLEHVIGHLVQNAIDASPDRTEVRVHAAREGARVRLEVADAGCGMTPEFVRERLFRPFQTTKPHGMGIGVYESEQYVRQVGGRLEVDSAPGRGTRVTVELVADDARAVHPAEREVA
jgi:putative PEP-CTERM system histidine kinase